jgi:hypothetical protein
MYFIFSFISFTYSLHALHINIVKLVPCISTIVCSSLYTNFRRCVVCSVSVKACVHECGWREGCVWAGGGREGSCLLKVAGKCRVPFRQVWLYYAVKPAE